MRRLLLAIEGDDQGQTNSNFGSGYRDDEEDEHLAIEICSKSRKGNQRSEEHTSELQSPCNLVCRLLLEKKKKIVENFIPLNGMNRNTIAHIHRPRLAPTSTRRRFTCLSIICRQRRRAPTGNTLIRKLV